MPSTRTAAKRSLFGCQTPFKCIHIDDEATFPRLSAHAKYSPGINCFHAEDPTTRRRRRHTYPPLGMDLLRRQDQVLQMRAPSTNEC